MNEEKVITCLRCVNHPKMSRDEFLDHLETEHKFDAGQREMTANDVRWAEHYYAHRDMWFAASCGIPYCMEQPEGLKNN